MPPAPPPDGKVIAATILRLAEARAPATLCPSEVARALAPDDWRPLLPAVRAAATELQAAGAIAVTQRGAPADPRAARGPIRLALPSQRGEDTSASD